jgi:hypothetical protein
MCDTFLEHLHKYIANITNDISLSDDKLNTRLNIIKKIEDMFVTDFVPIFYSIRESVNLNDKDKVRDELEKSFYSATEITGQLNYMREITINYIETESDRIPDTSPKLAGIKIPTNNIAIAQIDGNFQTIEIALTDKGFEPAILVVQTGLVARWIINSQAEDMIIIPAYYARRDLMQGANTLQLRPGNDFDFSNADNRFYGYVKVVSDLTQIDIPAIKAEVGAYETFIFPEAYFEERP